MRTSAAGGSSGIGGISIGKTKVLATNDVLAWDGSNWVNATASGGGGLTSVATNATLTGDGTVGAPLGVVGTFLSSVSVDSTISGNGTSGNPLGVAFALTAGTTTFNYGSSINYDNRGRIRGVVNNPVTDYTWVIQGSASVNSSATPIVPGTITQSGLLNNPGSAFSLTNCKFTAPTNGLYQFSVSGTISGVAPGIVGCGFVGLTNAFGVNTYSFYNYRDGNTITNPPFFCSGQMYLNAGDGCTLQIAQNTGSAQTASNMTIVITGSGKV